MSKQSQNNNSCDVTEISSIVINHQNPTKESSAPRIVATSFIAANAMILAMSPFSEAQLTSGLYENTFVEQGKTTDISSYPTVKVRYEEGQVIVESSSKDTVTDILKSTYCDTTMESTAEITFQQIISDLRKENAVLKEQLSNNFPAHTVVYLVTNGIVIAISLLLFVFRYIYSIYTIDPYYIICAFLIAMTLFMTALVSMKDWKDFVNGTR